MSRSANPFRYFNSSPEIIRLAVMMYVRFPLSLRNVEDLLFERGIDVCHETVRLKTIEAFIAGQIIQAASALSSTSVIESAAIMAGWAARCAYRAVVCT